MTDYPDAVYSPRTKENLPGVEYDATKKTIGYVEDVTKLDDEVVAIQTELGTNPRGAYATVKAWLEALTGLLHRKWSFADEESGFHDIRLPIGLWTDDGNALEVDPGEWDATAVTNPSIVIKSKDLWYMVYAGSDTTVGTKMLKIGIAFSTDQGANWVRGANNPILLPPPLYKYDLPAIIYDEDEDKFKLWISSYVASDGSDPTTQYFECDGTDDPTDGANWSSPTLCTGLTNFTYGLGVNKIAAGQFYYGNFRDTNNEVVAAYSTNGIAWTIIGTIIAKGSGGAFDDNITAYASLFWNMGIWYMLYAGHDGSRYRIGMATSVDGKTYTKHWYNGGLVLPTSSPVSSRWPQIVRWDKNYQLYVGYNDGTINSIRKYTKP